MGQPASLDGSLSGQTESTGVKWPRYPTARGGQSPELDFFGNGVDAFATTGTFTLTRADSAVGGRIVGTFDVLLDTGESINGAFDVAVVDVRQP